MTQLNRTRSKHARENPSEQPVLYEEHIMASNNNNVNDKIALTNQNQTPKEQSLKIEHRSLEAAEHLACTEHTKNASNLEGKICELITAYTNPNPEHPTLTADEYDTNNQYLKTPKRVTSMLPQERRKPADTPATDKPNQTKRLKECNQTLTTTTCRAKKTSQPRDSHHHTKDHQGAQ